MDQLSPQDAAFLYMETGHNLGHVTSVVVYDPSTVPGGRTVRFKDIIAHVEERMQASPLMRRRLVRVPLELDFPYWADDEYFDIEYHLRHGRLPAPGDWRQFCIHIARYHSRPLDMNRPLWEMYVIEGLDSIEGLPRGAYAIATKIHHAAVDGASMMKFFGALADIDNQGTPALPLEPAAPVPSPRPGVVDMARRAAFNNLRSPVGMADALLRSAPGVYHAMEKRLRGGRRERHKVPATRFNAPVAPNKMFDATVFPLDDLKAVRPAVPGCTINDVVLAICSGGLRRYLAHHGELPEEPLVAWVPINARPGGASDTGSEGNNITAMTTPIFTDLADPLERLAAIAGSTRESKEAKSGISARLMTDLSQHIPAATQVLASRLVIQSGVAGRTCNLFVSNVPGPQVPTYMNGARVWGSYGLAPLADGMGLFIATPSYDGKMSFNVISTREILPDIRFFIECLEQSLAELKSAAGVTDDSPAPVGAQRGRPTRTKAKTRKAGARPKAKAKSKAKAKPKAKAKSRAKPKAKAKAKSKAKTKTKGGPTAKTRTKTRA